MKAVLVISARDNVATALEPLDAGRRLFVEGHEIVVREVVSAGHKIAILPITAGAEVIKYGSAIGLATADIDQGAHVHTHNLASTRGRGDLASIRVVTDQTYQTDPTPVRLAEPTDDRQSAEMPAKEPAAARSIS